MRKVKILCTLGPSTDGKIKDLIDAGVNGVRLNMSHGTFAENAARIAEARRASKDVFVLIDTLGPKIRLGDFPARKITKGDAIVITTDKCTRGDKDCVPVQYKHLPKYVTKGNTILVEDGLVGLMIKKVEKTRIHTEVMFGDELKPRKGVNLPHVSIPFPYTTRQDRRNIEFAIQQKVDFIADSFVRNRADVRALRKLIKGTKIEIIAKIENFEGVKNIDEIIDEADGIMIARGDLGVEMPIEDIPRLQKQIITKCVCVGKPVITATQMLESMIENARPTRAEVSDVFNAVVDGTDCVMLSGETSIGKYPIETVRMMRKVTEEAAEQVRRVPPVVDDDAVAIISEAIAETADNPAVKAILIPTISGLTARMLTRYRLQKPIFALTPDESSRRQLGILWGVTVIPTAMFTPERIVDASIEEVHKRGYVKRGDLVVVTAGIGNVVAGQTNMIQIRRV